MATKKKNTLNEDVDLLNEGEKASETPATLVSPSPDQEYNATGALLSPNPAKSGFTSQRVVDSLPAQGEHNVIYIVPIKNNGGIIGYRKWRWDVETSSYKRVYGSIPNLALGNGQRETPVNTTNPNRTTPKVFNEDVVFNGQVKIGGKTIEDYVDSEGGVTQKELEDALKADKDILSQIKVNYSEQEDETILTFPEGVLPVSFYLTAGALDGYLYCDYNGNRLFDNDGNNVGGCSTADQQVKIYIQGEITGYAMTGLLFLHFNDDDGDGYGNWYDILNPTKVGTKLYRHEIVTSHEHSQVTICLTTPDSKIYQDETFGSLMDVLYYNGKLLFIDYSNTTQALYDYDNSKLTYIINGTISTLDISEFTIVSDTVTQL